MWNLLFLCFFYADAAEVIQLTKFGQNFVNGKTIAIATTLKVEAEGSC